jgi:hypothetical protein
MTSSSSMKVWRPAAAGNATQCGSTWPGMWITESELRGSGDATAGRIEVTRHGDRFPR